MAVYKVPQDVEADDKLIGPFSFRQFIYLIIVVLASGLAWVLGQLFLPLAIIPLPVILLFGALALPLRKDQPMEIYMAAIVSFFLKPHKRLWEPDGVDSLIEITVPKTIDVQRTKDLSEGEAQRRFGYLAQIVDSQGWAIRGADVRPPDSALNSDVYFAAQQVQDVMDNDNSTAQQFSYKLDQSEVRQRQNAVNLMYNQPANEVAPSTNNINYFNNSTSAVIEPAAKPLVTPTPEYDPYPEIRQTIVQPIDDSFHQANIDISEAKATTTSAKPTPAGIINLASNTDLSIETIAREANRIHKSQDDSEVVISLR
jgi:hypothetical protein